MTEGPDRGGLPREAAHMTSPHVEGEEGDYPSIAAVGLADMCSSAAVNVGRIWREKASRPVHARTKHL